jgi:hypothetical protein
MASCALALATIVALTTLRDAPVTLGVDVTELLLPQRELRSLTQETSAIWEPHGVALRWITSPVERFLPNAHHTVVVLGDDCPPAHARPPAGGRRALLRLGAVVFLEGRVVPENTLVLSLDATRRLVEEARWGDQPVASWPPAVRAELVGRAFGRVLAHEIGHYLIAWRAHTPEGLMRKDFDAGSLIDPDRRDFELSPMLAPRLRARLAQLSPPDATLAETR